MHLGLSTATTATSLEAGGGGWGAHVVLGTEDLEFAPAMDAGASPELDEGFELVR